MFAIVIDPEKKIVDERDVPDDDRYANWRAIVGGPLEICVDLGDGDRIYSNENGRLDGPYYWWAIDDRFVACGPAFIVGEEDEGYDFSFHPPALSLAQARAMIRFVDRDEARKIFTRMAVVRKDEAHAHAHQMGWPESSVFIPDCPFPEDEEPRLNEEKFQPPINCSKPGCTATSETPITDGWLLTIGNPRMPNGMYCPDHFRMVEGVGASPCDEVRA